MESAALPALSKASNPVTQGGSKSWLYQSTPSGRRLKPNVRGLIQRHYLNGRDIEIRTNSLGLRGPEIDWSRRPRFLFLGDSITHGDYLDERETFVALVRDLAERSGKSWETLNAGIGSIGIGTEHAILRELGPLIKPDMVVLGLYLNDLVSSPAVELVQLPPLLKHSWIAQYAYQAYSTGRFLLSEKNAITVRPGEWDAWKQQTAAQFPAGSGDYRDSRPAFNQLIQDSFRDWGSAWSESARGRILEEVASIEADCRKLGAKLVVALLPIRQQTETSFDSDEPQRALIAELQKRGTMTLDILPKLRAAYRQAPGEPLFYDQCHHTPKGSQLVAKSLFSFLDAAASSH